MRANDGSGEAVQWEISEELARLLWDARTEFRFGSRSGSVDECIRAAKEAPVRPVVISDSGDNPTAGAAGDVPYVLERLLALGATDAVFASIADPAAVARCRSAGIGSSFPPRETSVSPVPASRHCATAAASAMLA